MKSLLALSVLLSTLFVSAETWACDKMKGTWICTTTEGSYLTSIDFGSQDGQKTLIYDGDALALDGKRHDLKEIAYTVQCGSDSLTIDFVLTKDVADADGKRKDLETATEKYTLENAETLSYSLHKALGDKAASASGTCVKD